MTSATTTSRAIAALVEIMRDGEQAPRRRIEACEHLLDYECPREVIDEAKAVLMSIVEDGETLVDSKLDALKLLRRAEARKVVPPKATVRDDAASIEMHRDMDIAKRRMALLKADAWPPPEDWADDLLSPDYQPIPTEDDAKPVQSFAEVLRNARLARLSSAPIQKTISRSAGKNRVKSKAQKQVLSHT